MYFARIPACVAGVTGRCSLFGRHHVYTFDGVLYDFPGDCSYLLAGDCKHHSFTLLGESRSDAAMGLILTGICVLKQYMYFYYRSVVYATLFCHPPFKFDWRFNDHHCYFSQRFNVKSDGQNKCVFNPQVILSMAKELESLCFWGMPLNSTCL